MILLHLDIDETGQGIFWSDTPSSLLIEAVRSVVWFKDEALPIGGDRVVTSARNLLMFLSDVRGRKFKRGIFLGEDVLRLAETFRDAARTVAAGHFLPDLEKRPDGFHAIWRTLHPSPPPPSPFSLMRLLAALAVRRWRATSNATRPSMTPGSPPCAANRACFAGPNRTMRAN